MKRSIERHKTAISRGEMSLPMRTLLRYGFLDGQNTVFDYGCGRGDDLSFLKGLGVKASGWDPVYKKSAKRRTAEIVNLGYVLNVIEDKAERTETLQQAFHLAGKAILVSVMLGYQGKRDRYSDYEDGVITKRQTFQKYFSQEEFKSYLEETLERNAIPIAPGMCLVFANQVEEQLFLLSRQQVRREWRLLHRDPTDHKVAELVEQHRSTLDLYWSTVLELGRPAAPEECPEAQKLISLAGSWRKLHKWVGQFFDDEMYEAANLARHEDLLVYFAISHFSRRKFYSELPRRLQRDIQFFFGSITKARDAGRRILFAVGDTAKIEEAALFCYQELGIGHLNEGHDLIFHSSLLSETVPLIRVYVGCAAQLFGDAAEADLIKVHFHSGKATFLTYDDFEGKDVPLLVERIKVDLPRLRVDFFDYGSEYEPQPLEVAKEDLIGAGSGLSDRTA